jgi:ribosome-associated protein
MADTARNSTPQESVEAAIALAKLLALHNGIDVVVLDVSSQAGWTDAFVIATATSGAHLRGLERFVADEARSLGLERLHKISLADDDEWLLVDLGNVVVHVMTEGARAFYELEKLWFQSPATKVEAPGPEKTA